MYYHDSELNQISDFAVDKIEDILSYFEIDFNTYPRWISFSCPIHDSDNPESLSIFIDGDVRGNWVCWTNHCEKELLNDKDGTVKRPRGKNLFGLVRSLLSLKYNRHVEYGESIKWVREFLNFSPCESGSIDKTKEFRILSQERFVEQTSITRKFIRTKMKIPSSYFVNRKFNPEILDKYDVGDCFEKHKQMFGRAVVPVYDDNHQFMIGCLGRARYMECPKCQLYHGDIKCEDLKNKSYFVKWKYSKGFRCGNTFFNCWYAKEEIKKCGTCILVEGSGDVLKIEEAGIHNSLGLFGASLTSVQKILLNELGVFNVIIATDNDKAGQKAREDIVEALKREYNCYSIQCDKKDWGECSIEEIKQKFGSILERLC